MKNKKTKNKHKNNEEQTTNYTKENTQQILDTIGVTCSKIPEDSKDNYNYEFVPIENDTRIVIKPKAAYVFGNVKLEFKSRGAKLPAIPTEMLIDTGCMITTMSKEFYKELNNNEETQRYLDSDIKIKVASDETAPILGMTSVRLFFPKGITIDIDVMISEKLSHEFILGYDFLGSEFIKSQTNKHLIIRKNGYDTKIPLILKEYQPLATYAKKSAFINAFQTALIAFEVRNAERIKFDRTRFTMKSPQINNITILPTIYTYDKNGTNKFMIPIKNNSCNDIFINSNTKIAEVELIDEDDGEILENNIIDISSMQICNINAVAVDGNEQINKQKSANDNEKADLENNLTQEGYFKPTVTDYIREKSSITELGLEEIKDFTEEEFLNQFNLDNLSKKHKKKAQTIFMKNKKAFASHQYDIGKTNLIEMNINLSPMTKPLIQKYIPIPENAKEKVKEILDQLREHDIIRECNEPSNFCSNILVIKRKDGRIRLLFDGRLLNYQTERLPMATVSKPEVLSHLVNKKHLTSLDFADAFFHIPLDEESQPLTAFYSSVHSQRYCFTRAPMGLRNSPLYLKLLLDKVFADMHDSCILFFDDLLIATEGTLDEHLDIVDKVLKRIIKAGLRLRPKKISLAKEHIEFLGIVFSKGKMTIPEAKIEAFKKLPSPNTPKKAKSLVCALSFYRNFVPHFADLSKEIMDLSNLHPKQFKWTQEHEKKLRKLIDEVCKNSNLYLPNPKKRFYVQTDSSQNCGGGRVFQKDKDGNERLIAAVSRTYTKTERAYSIFKKEILALLYTLKTMDYFVRYADKLTILVDAKSIVYLRLAKDSSDILLRFSLELSKYNAEIIHVPGKENIISDVLSRHHSNIPEIINEKLNQKPLSEKESIQIIKRLTIPTDFSLMPEEVTSLLEGQSPYNLTKLANKVSKAKTGKRNIRNIPETLNSKKHNLPKTTNRRPGVILKDNFETDEYENINIKPKERIKRTRKFKKQARIDINNVIIQNNILTRAQKKLKDQENNENGPLTNTVNTSDENNSQGLTQVTNINSGNENMNKTKRIKNNNRKTQEDQIEQIKQVTEELIKIKEETIKRSKKGQTKTSKKKTPKSVSFSEEDEILILDDENDNKRKTEPVILKIKRSESKEDKNKFIEMCRKAKDILREDAEETKRQISKQRNDANKTQNTNDVLEDNDANNIQENNDANNAQEANDANKEIKENKRIRKPIILLDEDDQDMEIESTEEQNEQEEDGETTDTITYNDVKNYSQVITNGTITIKEFILAQKEDELCKNIMEKHEKGNVDLVGYEIINGVLFRNHRNCKRPILPRSLFYPMIHLKHNTIYGAHASKARILRDINQDYYVPKEEFEGILTSFIKECFICQLYNQKEKDHEVKTLPKPSKPRESWSIDIISNMPKTANNNSQILLCADDFTSFVVCIPLQDATSGSIIKGLKNYIFQPFGIPTTIRSDEQASFYNSAEFYKFMESFNIKLTPTAVAAPYSNSRAESQIKNIKKLARKFLFQEHCIDKWDEILPILNLSHNNSVGIYGYSAEQLMFGTKLANNYNPLKFDWTNGDEEHFVENIFKICEEKRKEALERMNKKSEQNKTYKNANREIKKFELGSLCLQRQMQVSTGKGSDYKPKFIGPYVILQLNNDESTAMIEHLGTGRVSKAHFTNLQKFFLNPKRVDFTSNFDKTIVDLKNTQIPEQPIDQN